VLPGGRPEGLPGWSKPVYHAMHRLPIFWGVPQTFGVFDFLLSLFLGMLWLPAGLLGALAWGIAWIGTRIEPNWLGILLEYPGHSTYEA
jgi:Type IV secretory pathway, VirB3-like protein